MSLKQVFDAWQRLNNKSKAWRGVLSDAGLHIDAHTPADFLAALERPIDINRDVPGFEDFAMDGNRGVEGGDPGRSLLYHAFAGAGVTEYRGQDLGTFPTLDEIIALENLIFGRAKATLKSLTEKARELSDPKAPELGIVIFSYDYVSAARTPHRKSADLCFSRTGLARAGTDREYYSPKDRGWFTFTSDDAAFTIRAIPARYAAFIAVRLAGDPSRFGPKYFLHTNLDQIGDQERQFWVPLHKLFSGPGCIADCPKLKVRFEAEHVNEKIRRIHLDSMRASIAAATQTVVDLTRVARSAGKVCLVVCANSVAAYATWPSQTAYSKAKRNQADVYETLSIPAIIVHFPVLYAAQCAGGGIVHGLLGAYFCFDTHASSIETASRILGAATILGQPNHCTRMFVKTRRYAMARLRSIPSQSLLKKSLAAFAAPFVLLLGKWVLRHDPAWQRLAAYALRYVLPRRLLSFDHHLVAEEHHTVGSPDLQMGALKFYLSDPWVCDARQEILEIADQE